MWVLEAVELDLQPALAGTGLGSRVLGVLLGHPSESRQESFLLLELGGWEGVEFLADQVAEVRVADPQLGAERETRLALG